MPDGLEWLTAIVVIFLAYTMGYFAAAIHAASERADDAQ